MTSIKNKKIVITGGTGFIGTGLVKRMISMGNRPTLLIRRQSIKKIRPFFPYVDLVETDLLAYKDVNNAINKIMPDIIFHLAGYGVYSYTDLNPNNTKIIIKTNVFATSNLLYAAEQSSCKIFINTGTCFEYGDSNNPFKETDSLNPCNIYGASKVMTSLACNILSKTFQMKIITIRPFTVYGPGQDDRRFITTVINNCLKGIDLKLAAKKTVRDYIFMEDVVDAYIIAAEKGKDFSGEAFNISTGKGLDLKSAAELIMQLTKSKKIKILEGMFPERNGEVHSLIGNSKKANELLNWKTKHSLQEGLLKTIEWHKQQTFTSKSL